MYITDLATGIEKEVWRINPKPKMWDHMYNFSKFAL
jgi:hypothetical protein